MLHSRPRRSLATLALARGGHWRAAFAGALLAAVLMPSAAAAEVWEEDPGNEDVDADPIVGQTTEFDPASSDLDTIQGRVQFHEDVDLYRVRIDDFDEFLFSVNGSGDNLDPKIYLFDGAGRGIAARDDGIPGVSSSPDPVLSFDCENPDPGGVTTELCELDGDDLPAEYLLGITRSDIVPYAPNPVANANCPGGSTPENGACPIFPSTMRWVTGEDGVRRIDFSKTQYRYSAMATQPVSAWKVVNPPPALNVTAENCNLVGDYVAVLDRVLFAQEPTESAQLVVTSQGDPDPSVPVDCVFVPEPSSSAGVGSGAVLLLRAWRGARRRKQARGVRGAAGRLTA